MNNIAILYVEDDELNQTIIAALLKTLGYINIKLANSAAEAINILEKEKMDIILMDLGLPDISGIELTKKIRDSEFAGKNASIIAVTGNSEEKAKNACLAAGMNGFLSKPVDKEKLQFAIENCLS